MNNKQISIYERIVPLIPAIKGDEKISYWLKKLHEQRELASKVAKKIIRKPAQKEVIDEQSAANEVREEHAKEQIKRIEIDKQKLYELVKKSNRSIITISSAFPYNLFPSTIDVEESRVTFIYRQLMTHQTHSVDVKDISNVFIDSGVFYASLQVVSRTFVQNDIKINHLDKAQASKVKSVIEGLRTFNQNNIDTSDYEVNDLVEKLCELNIAR